MRRSPLVPLIVLAALLQAGCYLYTGLFFSTMFLRLHQPVSTVLHGGLSLCVKAVVLVVAAIAYGRKPAVRPPLQIFAMLGGLYGLVLWQRSNLGHSWNVFHGDMVAIGSWSTVLFMLLGVLAFTDLLLTRSRHERRLRAFRS